MPIWTPPARPSSAPSTPPSNPALEDFLARARATSTPRRKLIFALDATDSRRPTWDRAASLTGEMFDVTSTNTRLDVQLVYYRGLNECRASQWFSDGTSLKTAMTKITTESGPTQIGKVLQHAAKEAASQKIGALVFIGDCCEEYPGDLYTQAHDLRAPIFAFQAGNDPEASIVFPKLARLTGGAHARFDHNAGDRLRDLLAAVARFAAAGVGALDSQTNAAARALLTQLKTSSNSRGRHEART
jgi:hypothetical protein